jgi:hypothetical protein
MQTTHLLHDAPLVDLVLLRPVRRHGCVLLFLLMCV